MKKAVDQKFAVICYAAALCVNFVLGVVLSAANLQGNASVYLSYALPQVAYIAAYCVVKLVRHGRSPLVEKSAVRPLDYAFGVLVAAGLLFFALLPNTYVTKLFAKIGLRASVIVPTFTAWYDYVLGTLIICVLPAIGEELVFRKAFCDGLGEVPAYKTILLCGLAFSLSHLNPAQTIHQFFLGVVLAACYVLTRNITVTMIMHVLNNALALYLQQITGAAFWTSLTVLGVSCALGAVALAAGLFFLFRSHKEVLRERKTGKIEWVTWIMIAVLAIAWGVVTALSFR